MNNENPVNSIDGLLEEIDLLDLSEPEENAVSRGKGVSFWLPDDYKQKYEVIQRRSKGKFHKLLKRVIKQAIDRAKVSDVA
jgi:hypothetical protein